MLKDISAQPVLSNSNRLIALKVPNSAERIDYDDDNSGRRFGVNLF